MSAQKNSLESQIAKVIEDHLASDRKLSKKAIDKIEKAAGKLSEKLQGLFDKEDRKAEKKAADKEQSE